MRRSLVLGGLLLLAGSLLGAAWWGIAEIGVAPAGVAAREEQRPAPVEAPVELAEPGLVRTESSGGAPSVVVAPAAREVASPAFVDASTGHLGTDLHGSIH